MADEGLLYCGYCRAVSYYLKSSEKEGRGEHKVICLAIRELSERNDIHHDLNSELCLFTL